MTKAFDWRVKIWRYWVTLEVELDVWTTIQSTRDPTVWRAFNINIGVVWQRRYLNDVTR